MNPINHYAFVAFTHSCNRLTRIIDLLQIESDAHQSELLRLSGHACPDLVGSLLSHSRAIDLLERHQREIRELLDHSTRVGNRARSRGPLAGSAGSVGDSPAVGVGDS